MSLTEDEYANTLLRLSREAIDRALESGNPAEHLHTLQVVKDYLWYFDTTYDEDKE